MNLSKTEKLLAAKKKLKEFQMSKMMQEKRRNESSDQQNAESKNQERRKSFTGGNGIAPSGKPPEEPCIYNEDTSVNDHVESNLSNETSEKDAELNFNAATSSEHWENIQGHAEGRFPHQEPVVECSIFQNSSAQEFLPSQQPENEANDVLDNVTDVRDVSVSDDIVGRPEKVPVQKEHLLEMVSAVENALNSNSTNNDNVSEPVEGEAENEMSYRSQFMNSYLEEQKKIVNDLHFEISSYRSRVSELEAKLASKEAEFEAQLLREITPLKEQLQSHAQTTGILIAERVELTASLDQTQQSAKKTLEELEEVSNKLKRSQVQAAELEKELTTLRVANEELRRAEQQRREELESLQEKHHALWMEKEELSLETSELKQKLNLKKTELVSTQQELQEKTALLSLSELRLLQMKDPQMKDDEQKSLRLEQELEETRRALKAVTEEKQQLATQYQAYLKWMEVEETKQATSNASVQQEYAERVLRLEQQLEEERAQKNQDWEAMVEELEQLRRKMTELTYEKNDLESSLAKKEEQLESARMELHRVKEQGKEQGGEVLKLVTALEGEQLAASRAVSQNQQLKHQLTDMENAFVSLSNDKLELTEQLQAERSIGRKLNAKLNAVETEVEELKEKLKERETSLEELEKERLQNAQIADQVQHYQAQGQSVQAYQLELESSLQTIEKMKRERQELMERLEKERAEFAERLRKEPQQESAEEAEKRVDSESADTVVENHQLNCQQEGVQKVDQCDRITDAMKKLQDRFKDTMERVAELTDEKQELEHLVMQLQSETETIGEYIMLYQKQRAMLQSRAREREYVFRQVLEQRNQIEEQRNQLLEQLHRLKQHVGEFLRKEVIKTTAKETSVPVDGVVEPMPAVESTDPRQEVVRQKSVSELLDLLTEIKDCNDSTAFDPNFHSNFHPCPWCSGKLLTV